MEKFEIEVLEYLKKGKFLDKLVFLGGTMLRLCYGLNRYSVDLDFWLIKRINISEFFDKLKKYLEKKYTIKDSANKFFTILFEISSKNYPKVLKIEIRKDIKKIKYEKTIAFSPYSNIQVLVNSLSLNDMLKFKIESFLKRGEIRDCFDIEFLLRKGVELKIEKTKGKKFLKKIENLSLNDYKVKLGSIVEKDVRQYYIKRNFEFLKSEFKRLIFNL
ncbi:MAG: nucleotidyl transferase AbiEii/AbiGii toxin family protein [Candidatus Omnitrophica bacterium]|nr:nucleotidyl transferase AbiEii/AbiGii toxin family protein [Candidatus Omnitrophota bacterium]